MTDYTFDVVNYSDNRKELAELREEISLAKKTIKNLSDPLKTKTSKARFLLSLGVNSCEITRVLGTTLKYVSNVKCELKKEESSNE